MKNKDWNPELWHCYVIAALLIGVVELLYRFL